MPHIALTIIGIGILWCLIFLNQAYVGTILGFVMVTWFFVSLKKKQNELEESFQKKFSGKKIRYLDKCAIFRAQESSGYSQSQGKGYLVLTDDELYFEMTLLNKAVKISSSRIEKAGKTNRLLGVNPANPMLKVDFKHEDGSHDAIALSVKELETWIIEITAVINPSYDERGHNKHYN